jgi:hypothetical protein
MKSQPQTADPKVLAKATRRRFSAAERARILEEYKDGSSIERAALCRREHIYATLTNTDTANPVTVFVRSHDEP